MLYAVCTSCTFLRAFGKEASSEAAPEQCPVCGSELMVRRQDDRFQPTYLGRVTLDLHATPALDPHHRRHA
jgi:hypothetical protein